MRWRIGREGCGFEIGKEEEKKKEERLRNATDIKRKFRELEEVNRLFSNIFDYFFLLLLLPRLWNIYKCDDAFKMKQL